MILSLKKARLLADKTQTEMSKALGICKQTYMKLEKYPDRVTIEQAKKISSITGISYNLIFFE